MQYKEITLTGSSIRNGRIYFSTSDIKFFPSNSLADREKDGHKGMLVKFIGDDFVAETDIRINSSKTLSPRKTFKPYLQKMKANEGSKLGIERISEREYKIQYID